MYREVTMNKRAFNLCLCVNCSLKRQRDGELVKLNLVRINKIMVD